MAAGNRAEDRSLVRSLSAALVNRVIILNVRVDVKEWLQWGHSAGVRHDILSFIIFSSDSLMRPIPPTPAPFSTPRAWVSLSRALDLLEKSGGLTPSTLKALVYGRVSPEDAAMFSIFMDYSFNQITDPESYIQNPSSLPKDRTRRWFVLHAIRQYVHVINERGSVFRSSPSQVQTFLASLSREERATLLLDLVPVWSKYGAGPTLLATLKEITGIADVF